MLGNFATYYGWIYDKTRGRIADRLTSEQLWQEGMKRTGEALVAAGIRVVEIRDTPQMYKSYKNCLSEEQWNICGRPRKEALAGMASPEIASPLYSILDLSDTLCTPRFCPAVIDGAIAYRDGNHLTATRAMAFHQSFARILKNARERAG